MPIMLQEETDIEWVHSQLLHYDRSLSQEYTLANKGTP